MEVSRRSLHQALVGRRALKAAIYPEGLCEATCRGFKREIRRSKMNVRVLTTVIPTDKIGTLHTKRTGDLSVLQTRYGLGRLDRSNFGSS